MHKAIHDTLLQHYGFEVLDTVIKSRAAYVESCMEGLGVVEHSDRLAKEEIIALGKEILKLAKKNSFLRKVA